MIEEGAPFLRGGFRQWRCHHQGALELALIPGLGGTQRHQQVRYLPVLIPLVSSHLPFPRPVGGTERRRRACCTVTAGRSPRCPWSIRHGPWPSPTPRRSGNRWARCCAPPERHDRIDEARGQLRSPNVAASRTVPRPTTWRSSPLALRLAVSTVTWLAGASEPCSGAGYFCWPETAGDEEPDRRRSSAARFVAHRVKPASCEDLTRLLVGSEGTLRDELGVGRRRRRSWR